MAVFAIGDVQGCADELKRLLDRLNFDPADDRLWFAGDLVNRGPRSLEVLRFVRGLGDRAVTVLGNHDLHLIAMAAGVRTPSHGLAPVLDAEDGPELVAWLRSRPLLWHDKSLGYVLVHAGLAPAWTLADAQRLAREVESVLDGPNGNELLHAMYGNRPERWTEELDGIERLRAIINVFTRLRYVTADGAFDFEHSGAPGTQPEGLMPWFQAPHRNNAGEHILFGHWSTLGPVDTPHVYPLDSGCVWGGELTAMRLDAEGGWYSIPCPRNARPKK